MLVKSMDHFKKLEEQCVAEMERRKEEDAKDRFKHTARAGESAMQSLQFYIKTNGWLIQIEQSGRVIFEDDANDQQNPASPAPAGEDVLYQDLERIISILKITSEM